MVRWHHQLNGREFEQAPEDGEGKGKSGVLQSMGSQRVRHDGEPEKQKIDINLLSVIQET